MYPPIAGPCGGGAIDETAFEKPVGVSIDRPKLGVCRTFETSPYPPPGTDC